jgi:Glycosyl transferase family 2
MNDQPEHDAASANARLVEINARMAKAEHTDQGPAPGRSWRDQAYFHLPRKVLRYGRWRAAVYFYTARDVVGRNRPRVIGHLRAKVRPLRAKLRPLRAKLKPRLWILQQYQPRDLVLPNSYTCINPPRDAPRISIVTPSYNHGPFVKQTIDSVLDQNYPNLGYFVQDGASTDNTIEILKSYGDRLGWKSEPDGGQGCAINLGFRRVAGDIMGYLNSDDMLLPGSLNYIAQVFQQDPTLDIVYGHRLCVNQEGREIAVWLLPQHNHEAIKWADFIPQETMFWRRRVWDAIGPFDETFHYALDWEFILRAQAKGFKFKRVPRFLACFRVYANQKTTANLAVGQKESDILRQRYLGSVPTQEGIVRAMRHYVSRHFVVDLLYRLRLYRP